jgi:hypothetical protein
MINYLYFAKSFLINTVDFCKRRWRLRQLAPGGGDLDEAMVTMEELRAHCEDKTEEEEEEDKDRDSEEASAASTAVAAEEEDDGVRFDTDVK